MEFIDDELAPRPDLEDPNLDMDAGVPVAPANSILKPRKKINLSDEERQRRREHMMRLREARSERAKERAEFMAKVEEEKISAKLKREEEKKRLADERINVRLKIQEAQKKVADEKIRKLEEKKKGKSAIAKTPVPPTPPVPPVAQAVMSAPSAPPAKKPKAKPKKNIKIVNKMESDDEGETDEEEDGVGGNIVIVNRLPKKSNYIPAPSASVAPARAEKKIETVCRFV